MSLCGIIAEYNPLHSGHRYQIQQARAVSGCERIAVVMSGAFVQRGEVAAFDKWSRAKWALMAGADVVFELPAAYALQAAPGFAGGGVRTLAATGMLDALSFGCEHGGEEELLALCDCSEHQGYDSLVKKYLSLGMSYAAAEQGALSALRPDLAHLVKKPNFMLGLSYARAIRAFAPHVQLATVRRKGANYNDPGLFGRLSSATAFRRALRSEKPEEREAALRALPSFVAEDAKKLHCGGMDELEQALLYSLRTKSPEELARFAGVDEGIEYPLVRAGGMTTMQEALFCVKSKRYTLARLRRMFCAILLGITKDMQKRANEGPKYLRVLGVKKDAKGLLGEIAKNAQVPLIVKKADAEQLREEDRWMYELDVFASDIAALSWRCRAGRDFTEPLITV
ncbi:MAG: nucleotidyltransferase family protein [Christensenellales bacterium]